MAITITIPTPKDVATSVRNRVRKTAHTAEFIVLSGVKRVSHAVAEKADALNEKIDDHANKTLEQ